MCGHVGRFFSVRLPPKGRSERGAPCSLVEMEVIEKSQQKRFPTTEYSDGGCGLPELTTRQNPNPSILKLFCGFYTVLREKEYSNSH